MAGITTLGHNTSVHTLFDQYFYTLSLLKRHPLTQVLAPDLEASRPELDAVQAEEQRLFFNQYDVDAAMKVVDGLFDGIVDGVDNNLLIDLQRNRNSPVYLRYFGARRASDLKRPRLGSQLEIMRDWPPSLLESQNPILQQYGTQLAAAVIEADAAEAAKKRNAQELTDFRVTGMRARFTDRFNAVRKSLFGRLSEIQHANPALGTGWAESFFRNGASSERLTLPELERRVASAELDLASLRKQRDERLAQQEREAEAEAEAELAEKLARLEAARIAMAELAAQIEELEDGIVDEQPGDEPGDDIDVPALAASGNR